MRDLRPIMYTMSKQTLLLQLFSLLCSHGVRSAPTISSLDQLPYNYDERLSNHIFAYPAGRCAALIDADDKIYDGIWRHKFFALEGDAYAAVFGHLKGVFGPAGPPVAADSFDDCFAACLEKGTLREVVARPLPHRYWRDGGVMDEGKVREVRDMDEFLASDSCGRVEYGFVNYHENPVEVYWVDGATGERVHNQRLGVGGERSTRFIGSFVGHRFQFYDSRPNEDPLENDRLMDVMVEGHGVVAVGNHRQPHVRREGVAGLVRGALHREWGRHLRIRRTFSALAFDKGRLPDDLFASLGAYHYNNRNPPHKALEEWGRQRGLFVNYWEADVNMIQIPWGLKRRWQGRLRELVEAWCGTELDITDMYGMREYTEGARLLTHVDRSSTHAASLIVNVAQHNVTRPWTVEIHDHADRLHEVVMEPGDIVYYESAKSLHGRNTPLLGGSYVNLFTHYRPKGDPEWYLKESPEGTPEPLMDVGRCRLEGGADQYSQGAVVCDDPAVGPHLSPTMFESKSGADLYRWWESVGPGGDRGALAGAGAAGAGEEL